MADCTNLRQQGITLVQKAIKYDQEGEYEAALRYYKQALDCFVPALKLERNPKIKSTLIPKVKEYMDRAEEIQAFISQEQAFEDELSVAPAVPAAPPKQAPAAPAAAAPKKVLAAPLSVSTGGYAQPQQQQQPLQPPQPQPQPSQSTMDLLSMFPKLPTTAPEQPAHTETPIQQQQPSQGQNTVISIKAGQTQCGYETLFKSYLRGVTSCVIEDPYVKTPFQIRNLLHFCEVVVKLSQAPKVSFELVTSLDPNADTASAQQSSLLDLALCLEAAGHSLKPTFVGEPPAVPKITLSSGVVIKSPDYGLSFYEEPEDPSSEFWIGVSEFDLRKCKETVIEISHV